MVGIVGAVHSGERQLTHSCSFLNDIDRIASQDYSPTTGMLTFPAILDTCPSNTEVQMISFMPEYKLWAWLSMLSTSASMEKT